MRTLTLWFALFTLILTFCTPAQVATPAPSATVTPANTPVPSTIPLSPATATPAVTITAVPTSMPTSTDRSTSASDEEGTVRYVVESFGKRLQNVSLQAPNAAQMIKEQYAEWVSSDLLGIWMSDPSKAPGRIVSSPWPDRIEITTLVKEGLDRYVISGFVGEVTSMEAVSGGAAAKIPVRMVVQKDQGRWLITRYDEER